MNLSYFPFQTTFWSQIYHLFPFYIFYNLLIYVMLYEMLSLVVYMTDVITLF